ncbi:sulfatase [Pseudalgibacter alginicilyticus]|nr:sulfatase [Pseudalgibacter alginicilyticus]
MKNVLFVFIMSLVFSYKTKSQTPNILFIAVDDLSTNLGVYGNNIVQSPNLDKLASEGTAFANHFVQIPTCGASRASMLTGLRPKNRAQLKNNILELVATTKKEEETPESFIHHLRRHGYYTVGIGKISHSADGLVYGYNDKPSETFELPFSWDEFLFDSGKWKTGWNAFFAYANGENRQSMKNQVKPYEAGNVGDEGYPDGLTAKLALSSLKKLKDSSEPFFLGVGFFKPHLPFNAPKKYWDLYDRGSILISENPSIPKHVNLKSLHDSGEFNSYKLTDEIPNLENQISDDYAKKLTHAYYASISYVDYQIGLVLNELKALGLDKNTIVVIWGDHGWHLGHQQIWGKHSLFENALKSTLIIKNPKAKTSGNVLDNVVETVDLYPTLMKLANIEIPYDLDGESLDGLLNSEEVKHTNTAYSYFKDGISLRTERYRLTKYFRVEEPNIELYDHLKDPNETINIAQKKKDIVTKLMPLLEKGNTGLYQTQ